MTNKRSNVLYNGRICMMKYEIVSPAFGGLAMTGTSYSTIQNLAFEFYHLLVICNLSFGI